MTIHLVTMADVHDEQIGPGCAVDQANVRRLFETVSDLTGLPVEDRHLEERSFDQDALVETIRRLDPVPDDAVVFYYSGHGQRVEGKADAWPYLALGRAATGQVQAFDTSWIYQALREKNPRMLMLVVDCCNVVVDARAQVVVSPKAAGRRLGRHVVPNLQELFGAFRGSVLAMGAQPGEEAAGTSEGGLFTNAMLGAIQRTAARPNATWGLIMERAGARIDYEIPGHGPRSQTPVYWVDRTDRITLREAPERGLKAVLYADLQDPEQLERTKDALLQLHLAGQECELQHVGKDLRDEGFAVSEILAEAADLIEDPEAEPLEWSEVEEAWDASVEAAEKLWAVGDKVAVNVLFPALDLFGEFLPQAKWVSSGGKLLHNILKTYKTIAATRSGGAEPLAAFDGVWRRARSAEPAPRAASAPATKGGDCPQCQANRDKGMRFCASCGRELGAQPAPPAPAPPRFCPGCGAELRGGQRFCASCGAAIAEVEPAVVSATAQVRAPVGSDHTGEEPAGSRLDQMQERLERRARSLQSEGASRLDEVRRRLKNR